MDESGDNISADDASVDSKTGLVKVKPKKRSLVERELETSLTARVTSPITNGGGSSTSRYGRARRLKTNNDFYDTEKAVTKMLKSPQYERTPVKSPTAYKMHASNSPVKIESPRMSLLESNLENQIENIYNANISLSRFGSEEKRKTSPSLPNKCQKVYMRKDLIQTKEKEEPITLIKNIFSPVKSAKKSQSHLRNILERSSEKYNLPTKVPTVAKSQNGYLDTSSVVKTLDFDSGNKKNKKSRKRESENKIVLSKSELFEMEAQCPYQVGDLAWARFGTYPFWPCLITREPGSGMFVKKKLFGKTEHNIIHVTFLYDNGRRNWIIDNMLRDFQGLVEFENARDSFTPEAKKKDQRLYQAFFISDKKLVPWHTSIEEAEMLQREPKRLRIDILNELLGRSTIKLTPKSQKGGKLTRADSDVSLSESLFDTLFSEDDRKNDDLDRTRNKSRNKSLDVSEVVTACLDNMAAKTGMAQIQKQSHMDRWLQKAKSKTPEKLQFNISVAVEVEKDIVNDCTPAKDTRENERTASSKKKQKPFPRETPVHKPYSLRKSTTESQTLLFHHNEHDYSKIDKIETIATQTDNIDLEDFEFQPDSAICVIDKVESLCGKEKDNTKDDQDMTDEKVTEMEVIDHEVADQEVADEEVADEEVADQEVPDQEVADQEVPDQAITDQEVADLESTEQDTFQEFTDQEITNQAVTAQEVTDKVVSTTECATIVNSEIQNEEVDIVLNADKTESANIDSSIANVTDSQTVSESLEKPPEEVKSTDIDSPLDNSEEELTPAVDFRLDSQDMYDDEEEIDGDEIESPMIDSPIFFDHPSREPEDNLADKSKNVEAMDVSMSEQDSISICASKAESNLPKESINKDMSINGEKLTSNKILSSDKTDNIEIRKHESISKDDTNESDKKRSTTFVKEARVIIESIKINDVQSKKTGIVTRSQRNKEMAGVSLKYVNNVPNGHIGDEASVNEKIYEVPIIGNFLDKSDLLKDNTFSESDNKRGWDPETISLDSLSSGISNTSEYLPKITKVVSVNGDKNNFCNKIPAGPKQPFSTESDNESMSSLDDITLSELKMRTEAKAKTVIRQSIESTNSIDSALSVNSQRKLRLLLTDCVLGPKRPVVKDITDDTVEEFEIAQEKTSPEANKCTKRVENEKKQLRLRSSSFKNTKNKATAEMNGYHERKTASPDITIKEVEFDTISIASTDSGASAKRRGKKPERSEMREPEFLKYLELNQDSLMDDYPELTEDEIVKYMYKTWQYEESLKSDQKKNDDIEQSSIVKGVSQESSRKKKKLPAKQTKVPVVKKILENATKQWKITEINRSPKKHSLRLRRSGSLIEAKVHGQDVNENKSLYSDQSVVEDKSSDTVDECELTPRNCSSETTKSAKKHNLQLLKSLSPAKAKENENVIEIIDLVEEKTTGPAKSVTRQNVIDSVEEFRTAKKKSSPETNKAGKKHKSLLLTSFFTVERKCNGEINSSRDKKKDSPEVSVEKDKFLNTVREIEPVEAKSSPETDKSSKKRKRALLKSLSPSGAKVNGDVDVKEIETAVPDCEIKEAELDTISIHSTDSVTSTKRKGKKREQTNLKDPDFLKYLELRQDSLMDEHPELTENEVVLYLYKTWQYEENLKSEQEKNDEIEQSNLFKDANLKQESSKKKKISKSRKLININKVICKEADKSPTKESPGKKYRELPKRKSVQPFYKEDFSDIEDEIQLFEIFKPSQKVPVVKNEVKDEVIKTSDEVKTEEPIIAKVSAKTEADDHEDKENKNEVEVLDDEYYDEEEMYFEQLTKPKPNIFKGLLREKVCEICEKTSNLVKCKSCNGMFHVDCVNKLEEVVEIPAPTRGRKKKKKHRGRKPKASIESNDDSHSDEKCQEANVSEENMSVEEIKEIETIVIDDVDNFEEQIAVKMKEMLESTQNIDYDSFESDDGMDWDKTEVGRCEIVDVKLRVKKEAVIEDYSDFKCKSCQEHDIPICFVCKSPVSPKNKVEKRQKCQVAHCHKYFHLECLEHWPQTQFASGEPSRNKKKIDEHFEAITCPRHVCHTCVCDDPRGCKTRFSGDKLARCVRCPATYHSFTKCLPAGSQILSASHIVCPRHYEHRPGKVPCHVNTGWCFICALGGTLICCEYCPTSFHADCLNIEPPEGGYMCEDCETGRLPLYGEMVWVKLGHYRWWPGVILHPSEIPDNLLAMKHSLGEFVVRFFGQYDHYWVNRGRVFPFQEGDSGRISGQKSKIDEAFTIAMEHAQRAFEILKNVEPNDEENQDIASSLLPPHYVKLKVNKPCGALYGKKIDIEESSLTQCECNPDVEEPCGPYSHCLNRMLLTECGPTCRAGERCQNRAFEKRLYPKLVPYRTQHRGWGLKTLEDIKAGQFVIEYVGELIDEAEFQRRMRRKHEMRDENYYFLTLDKERMIDAGPKGNLARFMNHCCEPNCETQKWTVLGDVRVGLFAIHDIPANTEVNFNYNLECAGIEKKRCMCGAKRCSGYMGAKPKQDDPQPKKAKIAAKRTYKKRKNTIESPSTSTSNIVKPKRPVGRPAKPRELTDIEKDLLIIKNATNGLSSDSEGSGRLSSTDVERKDAKALKRKRVSFSTDEVIIYNGSDSPIVKRLKLDDEKSSEVGD